MMNKIIFTQDIEEERPWLESKFPGFTNLQTSASGLWSTTVPEEKDDNKLYEISYRDNSDGVDWLKFNLSKTKSVYSNKNYDELFVSGFWAVSDFFISPFNFENKPKGNDFIILNLPRSGTMFLQSILTKKFNEFQSHHTATSYQENKDIVDKIKKNGLTVFLIYRINAWDWCTSNLIGLKYGYKHYNYFQKDLFQPFTVSTTDIDWLMDLQLATWNFWCNLKCYIPDLNCYLLEYSDIIKKFNTITDHAALPYDKKSIIANYHEMHNLFLKKYKTTFDLLIQNGSTHLKNMNCKTNLSDLNLL